MNTFPLNKDEWYSKRDNRTNLASQSRVNEFFSVGIIVEDCVKESFVTQVATITTVNILARWCRNISIQMPNSVNNLIKGTAEKTFNELIQNTIFAADPYNNFNFHSIYDESQNQIVVIGNSVKQFNKNIVWMNFSGWVAGIKYSLQPLEVVKYEENNPLGACFSACLGAAEIFKIALKNTSNSAYQSWISLYTHEQNEFFSSLTHNQTFSNDLSLGNIFQIGCGAVGSCLDYFLGFTNWNGKLKLIDYDTADISNCNRSLIFSAQDCYSNKYKTDLGNNALVHSNFELSLFNGDFDKYLTANNINEDFPDLILCLANERNIWNAIQNILPPLTLHATTTTNWGINFGRHIPKKEWCLLCRFGDNIKKETTYQCSESNLVTKPSLHSNEIGVLPFLSATAAIFMISEMAKLDNVAYPLNKNFVQYSLKNRKSNILNLTIPIKDGCECSNQPINIYPKNIKQSKYWYLVDNY